MRPQTIIIHASVALTVDRNGVLSSIFKETLANKVATGKSSPNCHSLKIHWLFGGHERNFYFPEAEVLLVNIAPSYIRLKKRLEKNALICV